ncbi:YgfZ/GcvT domain-containing protein [Haloferula sp.]|uniref:CAF17-like 4Fe-4S cluster assembly/insertion protein YgfZ n=1 Tax=Haloferula sp. TaxID=2497595 RepID=UPI00329DC685
MSDRQTLSPKHPTILSFSGPDAVRFLNGQVTQDVSALGEQALPACVTDAKGRLQYYVKLFAGQDKDALWITCPQERSDGLRERLERYLIADDVEVDDLTNQWACVHASDHDASSAFSRKSLGCFGDGFDCWWRAQDLPQIESIDESQAESLRIAARIPVWGKELTEGMLPPEAGLDKNSISYQKGCYIGQEVLSRIKTAGKLNRRLAAFTITGDTSDGDMLILDSKEVGHLTSSSPLQALGYLKKSGFDGSVFSITDGEGDTKGTAAILGWV